jgi:hypothetical protein
MLKPAPLILLILLGCLLPAGAQVAQPLGAIEIKGYLIKIEPKKEKLFRKRFYLLRGSRETNKALIERLQSAEPAARDCFYCRSKASPEFIEWLREKNCETPYCREITADDVKKVPGFLAAYRKGLKQFRRPELARKWIATNLPAGLRDGFYRQKKTLLAVLLGDASLMQSVMTDSMNAEASFIDIPLDPAATKPETFFVSNLLPIELGGKGYIWACEIAVPAGKPARLNLPLKSDKKCEVIVRPLPACAENCESK